LKCGQVGFADRDVQTEAAGWNRITDGCDNLLRGDGTTCWQLDFWILNEHQLGNRCQNVTTILKMDNSTKNGYVTQKMREIHVLQEDPRKTKTQQNGLLVNQHELSGTQQQ